MTKERIKQLEASIRQYRQMIGRCACRMQGECPPCDERRARIKALKKQLQPVWSARLGRSGLKAHGQANKQSRENLENKPETTWERGNT